VCGADSLQPLMDNAESEGRIIALAAQVSEIQLSQTGGHDLLRGVSAGFIGQMAVSPENALLQTPRRRGQS